MEEKIRRMLVQGHRIISQQICPYWVDGNATKASKAFWQELHDRLSMEIGVVSLSPLVYSYQYPFNGKTFTKTDLWTINKVCENWFMAPLPVKVDANRHVKERLSFIEICFRMRENELRQINTDLEKNIVVARNRQSPRGIRLPGDIGEGMRAVNEGRNAAFRSAVEELNTRFRQAGRQWLALPQRLHPTFCRPAHGSTD